ncbi:MAG: GTP-binding protein [Thermoplasmata archaeon]|nr:GTP-binding protein [Thermoplasmata archaeon]
MRKKVVLLGDEAVGKTSLVRRFVMNSFDDRYLSTIGTNMYKKEIQVPSEKWPIFVHMMIWDVMGQKNFDIVVEPALKGAHCVILVCDFMRKSTFRGLSDYWIPRVEKFSPGIPMCFLSNKSDMLEMAQFSMEEVEELASQYDSLSFSTSAKTGENVEEAFQKLGAMMLNVVVEGRRGK